MIEVNLTAQGIMTAIGALLSIVFQWFPKLNTWYAGLSKDRQSGLMLGLIVAGAVVVVGLGCGGLIAVVALVCTGPGLVNVAINFFLGLVLAMSANKGTYASIKQHAPARVKAIRAAGEAVPYQSRGEG